MSVVVQNHVTSGPEIWQRWYNSMSLFTVDIVHFKQEGTIIRVLPDNAKSRVERILGLLGMKDVVFTQPQGIKTVEKTSK
ncbi:hypothetical protein ABRT01_09075 [Lentibacillus sp. L22]|uniref:hypothetical protein n=1 Tax=Lentibacillus TaxID=175304 RepID=UPI0022B1555E|nr:hypothetical protein [Lentibacillus daqui]